MVRVKKQGQILAIALILSNPLTAIASIPNINNLPSIPQQPPTFKTSSNAEI
ncbi:hypothetical protein WJM97_20815 [Okeanomitos corallinicola TIOX110]|uniref:Uncharacterized protein n=1 Tax=Okeanomitos corallinicola TIOX110 TaxID=3133117 RepID=A0ABZ2UQW7_9CYAN